MNTDTNKESDDYKSIDDFNYVFTMYSNILQCDLYRYQHATQKNQLDRPTKHWKVNLNQRVTYAGNLSMVWSKLIKCLSLRANLILSSMSTLYMAYSIRYKLYLLPHVCFLLKISISSWYHILSHVAVYWR